MNDSILFLDSKLLMFKDFREWIFHLLKYLSYIFIRKDKIWQYKLIPIQISGNDSARVVDLSIDKNRYVLIKKLHVIFGKAKCKFVFRRCLSL